MAIDADPANPVEARRSSPSRGLYACGVLVSTFGSGLVLPITAIYLVKTLGFPAELAALAYVLLGVAGLLVGPFVVRVVDSGRPVTPMIIGLLAQATGFLVVASVGDRAILVLAGITVIGLGNGAVFTSRVPAVVSMFGRDSLGGMMALQAGVTNFALASGALLGTVVVDRFGSGAFAWVFAGNAATFLLFATLVSLLRARTGTAERAAAKALPPLHAIVLPLKDRTFRPLVAAQLLISVWGVAQLTSVIPVILVGDDGELGAVGAMFFVNCLAVVVFQWPAARMVRRFGPRLGLCLAVTVWLALYVGVALLDVAGHADARMFALAPAFGIIFALGEALSQPSLHPLVAAAAPAESLGAYAGVTALIGALAAMLGPSIGFLVVGTAGPGTYWIVLGAGMALALAALVRVDRTLGEVRPA